jgi:hypothetical protein
MGTQINVSLPLKLHRYTDRARKRHALGKCASPRCKNDHYKGSWFCSSCNNRQWVFNNPIKAAFRDHRANAKKRGHEWHITLEEYTEFVNKHFGYIERRGKFAEAWTLDRIKSHLPYTIDNVQILTLQVNAYKEHYRRKYGSEAAADAFAGVGPLTSLAEAQAIPCPF